VCARVDRCGEEHPLDTDEILRMTADQPEVDVADGDVLLHEGVQTGALYVLVAGVLEVRRRGRAVVQIAEPGAVVGELGLLLDAPASADVVALGPAVVRRVADARELFEQSPEFARHLATMLARRLWQISTYLSDLQEQFAGKGEIFELVPTVLRELLGASSAPDLEPGSERESDSPY
jgi:CRP-like cAMP-binding protein